MSTENGIDPAWEDLQPEEFPPHDELQDDKWLTGSPEKPEKLIFDPTAVAGEEYPDGTMGNDETEWGLERYRKIYGYDGLTLGELLQTGYKEHRKELTLYAMKQDTYQWLRPRLDMKIDETFYFRDLGVGPVGRWVQVFRRHKREILEQLGPMYDVVFKDGLDLFDNGNQKTKTVDVDSDFPQARLLMKQQDYAKDSSETYVETAGKDGQIDSLLRYNERYNELDQQVLDHLAQCFSAFYRTTNF